MRGGRDVEEMMAILAAPDEEPLPSLEALSREVAQIAAQLRLLADQEALARAEAGQSGAAPAIDARVIRAAIRIRRMRPLSFGIPLTNPGWLIMLELYACRLEGRSLRLNRVAALTGVAPTTVLRWVQTLTDEGLAARREEGPRNVRLELTDDGAARMAAYMAAGMKGARGR